METFDDEYVGLKEMTMDMKVDQVDGVICDLQENVMFYLEVYLNPAKWLNVI